MADKRLVDYFRRGLSQGYSIESLRKSLIRQGWPEIEVDKALKSIQNQQAAAPVEEGGGRPVGVIIVFALGILGSISGILFGALFVLSTMSETSIIPIEFFGALPQSILNQIFTIGTVNLVIGIIGLLAYILFFQMKKIGWILVILILIFSIVYGAINLAIGGFEISMLYGYIVNLIYMLIILAYIFLKRGLFL